MQKKSKRKNGREPARLKARKDGINKNKGNQNLSCQLNYVMTKSFIVEVCRQPTLARSHFKRKISQLNPLGFVIKIKERKDGPSRVTLCLQCV